MSATSGIRLKQCPPEGEGVNKWTFSTALVLYRLGWPADKITSFLHEHTTRSGEEAESEIERAAQNAPLWLKGQAGTSFRRWPATNASLVEKITSSGFRLDDLRDASPGECTRAHEVLPLLFPGDPLIWVASSLKPERGGTYRVHQLPFVASLKQFIVPNPMTSCSSSAPGKSSRCLANTGPRRFLVIERDQGTLDEQAAILWHLADFAPLALVVHSAGKSLHGWFYVAERTEAQSRKFMEFAVSLGADSATWCKCQPVRMPGGHRSGAGIQNVLFFNPGAMEANR